MRRINIITEKIISRIEYKKEREVRKILTLSSIVEGVRKWRNVRTTKYIQKWFEYYPGSRWDPYYFIVIPGDVAEEVARLATEVLSYAADNPEYRITATIIATMVRLIKKNSVRTQIKTVYKKYKPLGGGNYHVKGYKVITLPPGYVPVEVKSFSDNYIWIPDPSEVSDVDPEEAEIAEVTKKIADLGIPEEPAKKVAKLVASDGYELIITKKKEIELELTEQSLTAASSGSGIEVIYGDVEVKADKSCSELGAGYTCSGKFKVRVKKAPAAIEYWYVHDGSGAAIYHVYVFV